MRIGFVRSYARHLGLDAARYVERFKQEISGRADEAYTASLAPIHQDEGRRLPHGWRIVGAVVIVLLVYGGYHLFFNRGETNQTVPPAPDPHAQPPPKPCRRLPPSR